MERLYLFVLPGSDRICCKTLMLLARMNKTVLEHIQKT
jgi:hypothetical protein